MVSLKEKIKNFVFLDFLRENWKVFLWFLGLVLVCYVNSLGNEFVSDDVAGILQNEKIGDLKNVFSSPFSAFKSFPSLVYFVIYSIFGKVPMAFRMMNILFHFGVVSLVFILVSLLVKKRVAVMAGTLVAIHPLMIESVTWISGGGHVMYSFFLLLALFLYLLSLKGKRYFYWSFLPMMIAFSVSEKAVIYPLVLLLLVGCFRLGKREVKKLSIVFVPAGMVGLIFLSMLSDRLNWLKVDHYNSGGMVNPLELVVTAVSSYLGLMVWPDKLTLYHSDFEVNLWVMVAVFFLFVGGTSWLWVKKREWSFWPLVFFVSLLPVMTPFGASWVVAERYVYLGTVVMMVLLAVGLNELMRSKKWGGAGAVFTVLMVLGLMIRTIVRNNDWKNQDSLWLAAARTSPSSQQNHNNLGDYYGRIGDYERSIQEFSWAIELNPNYADAIHNRANVYVLVGRIDEAIEEYQKAVKINPKLWQSYQKLASVYFDLEDGDKSLEMIDEALKIDSENLSLHFNRGIILIKVGRNEEAKRELELILESDPGNEKIKKMLLDL